MIPHVIAPTGRRLRDSAADWMASAALAVGVIAVVSGVVWIVGAAAQTMAGR